MNAEIICAVCRYPHSAHRSLLLQSWSGLRAIPVIVIGQSAKRTRVKFLRGAMLPGKRFARTGSERLVPKDAIAERMPAICD
jgi:hypothetical protein